MGAEQGEVDEVVVIRGTRPAPGVPSSHQDAADVLRRHGEMLVGTEQHPLGVVRVDPDCILFVGKGRSAMTAWLVASDGKLQVRVVAGFPPWPSEPAV